MSTIPSGQPYPPPPGAGPGGPPGPGGPGYPPTAQTFGGPPGGQPPPRSSSNRTLVIVLLAVGVVALIAAVTVVLVSRSDSGDETKTADHDQEVFLEPISTSRDPFTEPVGKGEAKARTVAASRPAAGAGSGIAQTPGGEPGLYGGTQKEGACDKQKLITFLRQNPDKAKAWAEVVGIRQADIEPFIDKLTPVLLISDTRVTNHGYANGRATSIQSVLQAGTAVLVDDYGTPVTKCFCGNPLTAPVASPAVYYGNRWTDFDDGDLTVVIQNDVVINNFTLIDIDTGDTFIRPAGTDGREDTPANATTTTTTTTTLPSQTIPRTTPSTSPPTEPTTTTHPPPADTTVPGGPDPLDGTYQLSASVGPGSDPSCTAYQPQFTVTVTGSGTGRQVTLDFSGTTFTAPLSPANSFSASAPLTSGSGTQTIEGQFQGSGPGATIVGTSTIDLNPGVCNIVYSAAKV